MEKKQRMWRQAVALSVIWLFVCAAFLSFRLGHIDPGPGKHVYTTQAPECLASCVMTDEGFPFRKYEDGASNAIFAITGAKYFDKPTAIYVDVVGLVSLLLFPVAGIFLLSFLYTWVCRGAGKAGN